MDSYRINGRAFDYGSTIWRVGGDPYEGWKSTKYSQKRTRAKVPGATRDRIPKGKTRGTYEAENFTATMLRRSAQDLREQIARLSTNGLSYGDPIFGMTLQYVELGLGPIMDQFFGCSIESDAGGAEDNADPLYEDVVISVLKLSRNGLTLYGSFI